MWKLLNKYFGWDYIHWENTAAYGIARVRMTPDGVVYYWRYESVSCLDKITKSTQVVWLTCEASKYMKKKELEE